MSKRIYMTVLIYLKEGQESLFHDYERQAAKVMMRHNGRFEQIIKPNIVNGDLPLPDEIHVLSFATPDGFSSYRQDPASQALAPMRLASVEKAIFLQGTTLNYLDTAD